MLKKEINESVIKAIVEGDIGYLENLVRDRVRLTLERLHISNIYLAELMPLMYLDNIYPEEMGLTSFTRTPFKLALEFDRHKTFEFLLTQLSIDVAAESRGYTYLKEKIMDIMSDALDICKADVAESVSKRYGLEREFNDLVHMHRLKG